MTINFGLIALLSQTERFDGLAANDPKACVAPFRKMRLPEQAGAIRRTLGCVFCDPRRLDEIAGRTVDA